MSIQGDPKKELERIRPLIELMEHKGWKSLKYRMEQDIPILVDLSWRVGSAPSPAMVQALTRLGIPEPKTKEEMFDCFHQFRAVVNYIRNTLGYLEKEKRRYETLRVVVAQKEIKDG